VFLVSNVQNSLKDYFNSKPFFRGAMAIDFVIYGLGFVLMVVGSFVLQIAEAFVNLGIIMFWAGIVFGFAKKNDIGLTIAFSAYGLFNLLILILALARPYGYSFFSFGSLCHVIIATLLLIATIRGAEYYKKYQQNKQLVVQAAAAQVAMASQQNGFIRNCVSCGAPLEGAAIFCSKCGTKQQEKQFCPHCGAEISGNSAFCSKCGGGLNLK